MSKLTKKELQYQINGLAAEASTRHNSIMRIHRALASIGVDIFSDDFDLTESKPQLKQLDQSVFDGLDEKWQFAAVDEDGSVAVYLARPICNYLQWYVEDKSLGLSYKYFSNKKGYDTSNWQNSLIERDIAKELLEVDLSSELTGSELCRAILERGDKYVMCMTDCGVDVIHDLACFVSSTHPYIGRLGNYKKVTPINNQGEPLTQAEAGL